MTHLRFRPEGQPNASGGVFEHDLPPLAHPSRPWRAGAFHAGGFADRFAFVQQMRALSVPHPPWFGSRAEPPLPRLFLMIIQPLVRFGH